MSNVNKKEKKVYVVRILSSRNDTKDLIITLHKIRFLQFSICQISKCLSKSRPKVQSVFDMSSANSFVRTKNVA